MTTQRKSWLYGPYSQLGYTIMVLTLAFDQAHKWWMLLIYRIQEKSRVVVTPFLDLVFVKNKGVSYGLLLQDSEQGQWLLAGFAVLAALAMAIWLARGVTDKLVAVSLGLIMGGALGNAIDRLLIGGVADFFSAARLRLLLVRVQYRRYGHCCRGGRPSI